jgi:hypothetical protein
LIDPSRWPRYVIQTSNALCRIKDSASLADDDQLTVAPSLGARLFQWLELAAHNGLVAGSSPAGPTTLGGLCGLRKNDSIAV